MDGAILVVAATDGPMPQTREHILLVETGRSTIHHSIPEQVQTMVDDRGAAGSGRDGSKRAA